MQFQIATIAAALLVCSSGPILGQTQPSNAATPIVDRRLAEAKRAATIPIDPLEIDQPIAACVSEQLSTMTPLQSVARADDADLILRVGGHIASDADRSWENLRRERVKSGLKPDPNIPTIDIRTTSEISAELPDGTVLWREKYFHGTDHGDGVECRIAHDLLTILRDAMKRSRDGGQ